MKILMSFCTLCFPISMLMFIIVLFLMVISMVYEWDIFNLIIALLSVAIMLMTIFLLHLLTKECVIPILLKIWS
jgi:hypothetical protein